MNTPQFSSVLDRPSSTIDRPKPLPVGTYLCSVKGLPRIDKSSKKQTEFSEYTLQILQPLDDVDTEALEAMGGWQGKTVRATFYHTEDAVWRLKKFLVEDLQIEEDEDGVEKTIRRMMQEVAGRQVLVNMRHRASEDGQAVYAEVGSTAAVE